MSPKEAPTEQQEIDDGEEVSRFLRSEPAIRTIERQRVLYKDAMAAAKNAETLQQVWSRLQAFEDLIVALDTTKQRGEVRKIKKDAAEKAAKIKKA